MPAILISNVPFETARARALNTGQWSMKGERGDWDRDYPGGGPTEWWSRDGGGRIAVYKNLPNGNLATESSAVIEDLIYLQIDIGSDTLLDMGGSSYGEPMYWWQNWTQDAARYQRLFDLVAGEIKAEQAAWQAKQQIMEEVDKESDATIDVLGEFMKGIDDSN